MNHDSWTTIRQKITQNIIEVLLVYWYIWYIIEVFVNEFSLTKKRCLFGYTHRAREKSAKKTQVTSDTERQNKHNYSNITWYLLQINRTRACLQHATNIKEKPAAITVEKTE
jgi:hypothetical protein